MEGLSEKDLRQRSETLNSIVGTPQRFQEQWKMPNSCGDL